MAKVIERRIEEQLGKPPLGGDRIAVAQDDQGAYLVFAIDGVNPKTPAEFEGKKGDAFAAEKIVDIVQELPRGLSSHEVVQRLTQSFKQQVIEAYGLNWYASEGPPPIAHLIFWNEADHKIVRLGDGTYHVQTPDQLAQGICPEANYSKKRIDHAVEQLRAAFNRRQIALNLKAPQDLVTSNDLGRKMVEGILRGQHFFGNDPDPRNPYAFAVLDGQDIPEHLIEVFDVPAERGTIVTLATDGIIKLVPDARGQISLTESFRHTRDAVWQDPLRSFDFPASGGTDPNNPSPPDRSMVQFIL